MKMAINKNGARVFESFSFTVTVETPQEARLWFHVFNKGHLATSIFTNGYPGRSYNRDVSDTLEPSDEIRTFIRSRVDIDI
jgi:hypothetical protein